MLPREKFRWRAVWGGRVESAESIADRLAHTLATLETLGGELGRHFTEVHTRTDATAHRDTLADLITAGFEFDTESRKHLWVNGSSTSFVQGPHTIRIRAGGERRTVRSVPNSVNIVFGANFAIAEELLPRASALFDLLISAWTPDAVCLDSASLWDLDPDAGSEPELPPVGYLTWLSDRVSTRISEIPGATVSWVADGTLVSIDFASDDLVQRAESVSRFLHSGGYLSTLPLVQG